MRAVGGRIREIRRPGRLVRQRRLRPPGAERAARSLLLAALPCAIAGVGLLFLRSARKLALVLAIVAAGEMLLFALVHPADVPPGREPAAGAEALLRGPSRRLPHPHPGNPDAAMSLRAYDIWGYAPLLPGRFAEFMDASQGRNPDKATSYLEFHSSTFRVYKMLAASLRDRRSETLRRTATEFPDAMPHVALIRRVRRRARTATALFDAMLDPSFDPAQKVILESRAGPEPARLRRAGAGASDGVRHATSSTSRPTWTSRRSCSSPTTTPRPGARGGCRAAASRSTR